MANPTVESIVEDAEALFDRLADLPEDEKVDAINRIKIALSVRSPFRGEPVDCVIWAPAEEVHANDYNPNKVAPPEMSLLAHSIECDGYTQPIVTCPEDGKITVVDGFHRNRCGREVPAIRDRVKGYLPIVFIREDRKDRNHRIAATVRHNRARGKHGVEAMSQLVLELSRRNWTDKRIAKELGMDADEVLRLKQITGLADAFANAEFSEAWELVEEEL